MEKKEIIRNPLTLIAIFAGLSEVSMTAVLPLLPVDNQRIFMWFVMIYPSLLVCGFFYILIWKREALYAPSDFKDDATWLEVMRDNERKILERYPVERAVTPSNKKDESDAEGIADTNRFYSLLKSFDLTENEIKLITSNANNADDIPKLISDHTSIKNAPEKIKRILVDFPSSKDDFNKLKNMLEGGN